MPELATLCLPREEMEALAQSLALVLRSGDVVTLSGDLGAGKTAFARALIRKLTPGGPEVTSPTFTLMQNYDVILGDRSPEVLWHLDLYRIERPADLDALGLEEILDHVTLIEWPEAARGVIGENCLAIAFTFAEETLARKLIISGNAAWRKRLSGVL